MLFESISFPIWLPITFSSIQNIMIQRYDWDGVVAIYKCINCKFVHPECDRGVLWQVASKCHTRLYQMYERVESELAGFLSSFGMIAFRMPPAVIQQQSTLKI